MNQAAAYFYGEGVQIDYAKSFELLNQTEVLTEAQEVTPAELQTD